MQIFKAIAAVSENGVIGVGGKIPWHIPEDFRWFKSQTIGKTVLMGRKTFESLGKPLPSRLNVVLTRNPKILSGAEGLSEIYKGAKVSSAAIAALRADAHPQFPSLSHLRPTEVALLSGFEEFLSKFQSETWVIGGAATYEATLQYCSDLYLTRVKRNVDGDTFFPAFESMFIENERIRDHPDFSIIHYRRVTKFSAQS